MFDIGAASRSAPARGGDRPLGELVTALAEIDGVGMSDVERIDGLEVLERVKAACAAAQARLTESFVESQAAVAKAWRERAMECSAAGDFDGWCAAREQAGRAEVEWLGASAGDDQTDHAGHLARRGSGPRSARPTAGVSAQIGLARRESPARAARMVSTSLSLVRHLPHTLALLTAGELSERRAEIVVRAVSHLTPQLRAAVDEEVVGAHRASCGTWGDREIERRVRACADRLDAKAAVERARIAESERRVTIRPVPDAMVLVSATLPVAQGVALHATLARAALAAKATGDHRTQGQVMADTLVQRVIAESAASAPKGEIPAGPPGVPVELQLVMTDCALITGDDTPAQVPGYGPIPAAWARELLSRGVRDDPRGDPRTNRASVWLRRLLTHPGTGTLVALESRRRLFPAALRRFVIARDGTCRTPWCDAPIRHIDHVQPWAAGGPTVDTNGQGLCVTCNLTRAQPGWSSRTIRPGPTGHRSTRLPHTVMVTTPTGQTHTSTAPPVLPGPVGRSALRVVGGDVSPLEADLVRCLAA